MIKLREAILVEGRYDKNALRQLVDAPVFESGGFGIRNDKELMTFLRNTAERRGLIVLTDSDGAGFQIRRFIKESIPAKYLKHAYIPDIYGKESRKKAPGREGKLGVEGMPPQVLIEALLRCGAEVESAESEAERAKGITKTDFFNLGLSGCEDSCIKRSCLKRKMGLPEHLSTNGLLDAINIMFEREEFLLFMEEQRYPVEEEL